MKKILATLIALSLPTFALADATKGFYVQADAGYRYNYWGKFEETKLQSHELSAGVRVKF